MTETQAVAVRPTQQLDTLTVGRLIAQSGYFADAKDQAQAVVKILAGQEIGVGPIASMMGIYIVSGKPTYSANLIAALIKRSGRYDYRVRTWDAKQCVIAFFEQGQELGESAFTLQDAETAELTTGRNAHSWKHYPKNMLFARALTNGARTYCPDVSSGIPLYTPEELDATVDGASGQVIIESPPARPPRAERDDVEPVTGEIVDAETIPFDDTVDEPPPIPKDTAAEKTKRRAEMERRMAQLLSAGNRLGLDLAPYAFSDSTTDGALEARGAKLAAAVKDAADKQTAKA